MDALNYFNFFFLNSSVNSNKLKEEIITCLLAWVTDKYVQFSDENFYFSQNHPSFH